MNRLVFQIFAPIALLGFPYLASAQSLSFVQIAQTGIPVPKTGGVFTSFGLPSADREYQDTPFPDNFFFQAQSSNGASGIYYSATKTLSVGTLMSLARVADTTMAALTGGTFTSFSNTSSGWGAMGFIAQSSSGAQGIYEADSGYPHGDYDTVRLIAQTGQSPGAGVTFGSFQGLSLMGYGQQGDGYGDEINGEILSDVGVYDFAFASAQIVPEPATFSLMANINSVPPTGASPPFTTFGTPSYKSYRFSTVGGIRHTVSAFTATAGGVQGIYYNMNNIYGGGPAPIKLLISAGAPIPGGAGTFTRFGNPVASSGEIAFTANYNTPSGSQQGIFSYGQYLDYGTFAQSAPPTLYQILATGQTAPNSNGAHFASFGTIALAEVGGGLFTATLDNGIEGLYSFGDNEYEDGDGITGPLVVTKFLDTQDTLDGKLIADIELSSEALGTAGGVFKVDFTDGSQGIYYYSAALPEPVLISFLPLSMLLVRRRK